MSEAPRAFRDRLASLGASARRELLEADPRGLAVFRVVYGLGMLLYLGSRVTGDSFVAFHTDLGVLPRERLLESPFVPNAFSLFFAVGSPLAVAAMFAVCFALVASFTVGYRTRTSAVGTLVVLISLHHRLPHVVNAAMCLSHLVSLYSLALPLGDHYSVDAWLAARRGQPTRRVERVRSLGVFAFRLQLAYVYFFNVAHKDGETWRNGDAVFVALHDDRITRAYTPFVREFLPEALLRSATYATLLLELGIALALVSPIFPRACRRFATGAIVTLHLTIALFLRLGPFPVVLPSAALLVAASGDYAAFDARIAGHLRRLEGWAEKAFRLSPAAPPHPIEVPSMLRKVGVAMRETYFAALATVVLSIVRHDAGFLVERFGPFALPAPVTAIGTLLYIPQGWGMFAPDPARVVGVFVVDMELEDGRHVDPLTHRAPGFPDFGGRSFGTDYFWQVYQPRIARAATSDPALVELLLDYLCRIPVLERWPGTHRIRAVELYYYGGPTRDPRGHPVEPPRRHLLGRRGARFREPFHADPVDAALPGAIDARPSEGSATRRATRGP